MGDEYIGLELEALKAKEQELIRVIDASFPLRSDPKITEFINSQYIELDVVRRKIDMRLQTESGD
jgi:hypothetical protein